MPAPFVNKPGVGWVYEKVRAKETTAVLAFEDKTGDPSLAHWHKTLRRLVGGDLYEIKSANLLWAAPHYAFTALKIDEEGHITEETATKLVNFMRVDRVVWGDYTQDQRGWQANVKVLFSDRSSNRFSTFTSSGTNWLHLRDELTRRLLKELGVTPEKDETERLGKRFTLSEEAFEWYWKASAATNKETQIEYYKNAIAADPKFVWPYADLAQAQLDANHAQEAEKTIREAVLRVPSDSVVFEYLGRVLLAQSRSREAEDACKEAIRLRPEREQLWRLLGDSRHEADKLDEALEAYKEAARLRPYEAYPWGRMAGVMAEKRQRPEAMQALMEATQRMRPGEYHVEQLLAYAYSALGEKGEALKHGKNYLAGARADKVEDPAMSEWAEKVEADLAKRGVMTPVSASIPRTCTSTKLDAELKKRLTADEYKNIVIPFAANRAMTNWAMSLTAQGSNELSKARMLFAELTNKFNLGNGGTRTATEVFSKWTDARQSFSCQEYTKLFIALARAVDVPCFYVHLERDYNSNIVYHDCAAIVVNKQVFLVDPSYRWFGVPHKDFVLLDDVQAVAHHYFQVEENGGSGEVARCRIAEKLHPNFAWGKVVLGAALCHNEELAAGLRALDAAERLEPGRWDTAFWRRVIELRQKRLEQAAVHLKVATKRNPKNPDAHLFLATAYHEQDKLSESREEVNTALKFGLDARGDKTARNLLEQLDQARSASKQ